MIHFFASIVRDKIPSYLESVPIPRSIGGFMDLSVKDWLHLIVFTGAVGTAGYYATKPYIDAYKKRNGICDGVINLKIKKDCKKVYDVVDIESIGEKASFCRCWRSEKFPYCDGTHNKHNEETGDNVAPLVVKRIKD